MTNNAPSSFFALKFHTNHFEISPKTLRTFGSKEILRVLEDHFQGNWGYLDEADLHRNEDSLRKRSGEIESRFNPLESGQILFVESSLDESWTYVSVFGEV